MKICPYCGEEYPDEALRCASDGEPLVEDPSRIWRAPKPAAGPKKESNYLTYPDYQWSANDAWKCLGMTVIFGVIFYLAYPALDSKSPAFFAWRRTGFGYFSCSLLFQSAFLVVAAYFARTETLSSFWKAFSLDRRPGGYAVFGIVCALLIRATGHIAISQGWSHGVSIYAIRGYNHSHGLGRIFFLVPVVLVAPIFEEAANRGFIFKAFRGSYSLGKSVLFLVSWTVVTHWSYYTQSLAAVFALSLLTIIQCYVREKSDSLWDCILCHLAFNASLLFVPGILK